ncbi:aspartic peptidase domain-containing protein [Dactylonectria estremocensis]|uniref:Aspartic peptidase domain-containing protein n=1 Tax=Dactylonectria estremocensis TaxID=1079267 RepID=A0A9P9FF12_9HYPO|nr:aspartic peptidase domain-containing protein [Dactylonectria estremocensis]
MRPTILATGVAFAGLAHARRPGPVSIPSSIWKGIDGNWSTVTFYVGSNSQQVDVLVSTSLSEFWAVGSGGCLLNELHCISARGGVFTPSESNNWSSMGTWQLGLNYLGYGGNGDYGRDMIALGDDSFHMSNVLIATLNTTNYLNGLFGLGITQGNFGGTVAESPLTQAVKEFGWIPSYSYGYTAGAHYRNTPVSLTLGGYDESRFSNHNTDFTLARDDGIASPLVRGIEVTTSGDRATPNSWNSSSLMLSSWNSSFNAIVDSTTPYLWLPDAVCDRFADAFNLTYNSTFDLYTVTDEQYASLTEDDSFSFTFVLSSFDNNDNFGNPYDLTGIVNITVPSKAFIGVLQYPFMNRTIEYGEPSIPYFMLRRANESSTFILGRSFLQESYLITRFDESVFSIHQAKFPNSSDDIELTAIKQPDNSPYPPPAASSSSGLTKAQKAGIGVGAGVLLASLFAIALWLCKRRRQKTDYERAGSSMDEKKGSTPDGMAATPKSPLQRILSKMVFRRKKSPKPAVEITNDKQQPSEAPDSEIYELPAPVPPAELNGDDTTSWNGDTELGTENSHQQTAYQLARRKMEQQLQGPVPAYSPPADGVLPPPEKTIYEPTQPRRPPPALQLSLSSPPSSPGDGSSNSNTLPLSLPSPMTPRHDLSGRPADFPSPLTVDFAISSTQNTGSSSVPSSTLASPISGSFETDGPRWSVSNHDASLASALAPPSPVRVPQRTPIDLSKIVYLGPMPGSTPEPRPRSAQETRIRSESIDVAPRGHGTSDTLGSNFTMEEAARFALRLQGLPEQSGSGDGRPVRLHDGLVSGPGSPKGRSRSMSQPDAMQSQGRITLGTELVHVPQMAEKRYSWEEER